MRITVLGSIGALLAGAGLALAQETPMPLPAITGDAVIMAQEAPRTATPGVPGTAGVPGVAGVPATSGTTVVVTPGYAAGGYAAAPYAGYPSADCQSCGSTKRGSLFNGAWFSAEYLLWTLKEQPLPEPLLATTFDGDPFALPIAGRAGTVVVFGQQDVEWDKSFNGVRLFGGFTLDCQYPLTIGVGGFFLQERSQDASFRSQDDGSRTFGRPFQDATNNNVEATFLVSFPGAFAGNAAFDVSSEMRGGEIIVMGNVCCAPWFALDWLAGFRYLNLEEHLNIRTQTTVLEGGIGFFGGAGVDAGGVLNTRESFETSTSFYGGEIGVRAEIRPCKCLFTYVTAKVGLGMSSQEVSVDGSTSLSNADNAGTLPGGLLALPTNIGTHTDDQFSVVPEISLNVGYDVTKTCRIFAGYSFLYWSDVVRPGEQIDRSVNLNLVPASPTFGTPGGGTTPQVPLKSSDFWAHGFNLGFGVRF